MDGPVVTCFLRNDGEILLLRRSDGAGRSRGQWDGVAGPVERDDGTERDPETAARAEIAEKTGLADAVTLVRPGEPVPVEDGERRFPVHPFLFDCDSRAVEADDGTAEYEWVHAPEILRRETVPWLWASYDRVRPRVATLADRTHGSAWLSLRALETLRDESALAGLNRDGAGETSERDGDGWSALADLARRLRGSRPSMAVLENRVNRVMTAAIDERTAEAVERAGRGAIAQAVDADSEAARLAVDAVGERVATLSRSGTVAAALRAADPEAVLVAESRPGGEGVGVAESLADAAAVTLTTDAAFPFELDEWDADTLVVGADRVLPDGRVVNKAGTRGAALAAAEAGVDCLVVAASDKVAADGEYDLEPRDPDELYDGDADVTVANPTFDVTPADAVASVVTEQGQLSTDEVAAVAAAHREWTAWDR
ncbi:NUDIX domain-containing protein [Haloarcula laminariae]|uniref:NUDIX domain-containing protein n=1 Tax=Haloarcula laminariae TaxID=2961577 RepID=UPI0021C9DA7A|nr:NUDIX domain-containing protein [Halomicroarcula laminariae]